MKQGGQSTLYAIMLMPTLLMAMSLVADVGSLQVHRVQLSWANDMALVDAVTEVDPAFYADTGRLRLDPAAITIFRQYLALNLEPLRNQMAGTTPSSVAEGAEVVIVNSTPATNPFSGHLLDRPAICARIKVPFRTGLLALAGLTPVRTLTISGDAEIKTDA
ncbi:MAG: pilus assembly protein TadG-related protein [Candidatus Dormibacteraeota bacterium]|nr:pilus assembly protein TadG-related protein [Candidatus Dormibacteraeota bacterium]